MARPVFAPTGSGKYDKIDEAVVFIPTTTSLETTLLEFWGLVSQVLQDIRSGRRWKFMDVGGQAVKAPYGINISYGPSSEVRGPLSGPESSERHHVTRVHQYVLYIAFHFGPNGKNYWSFDLIDKFTDAMPTTLDFAEGPVEDLGGFNIAALQHEFSPEIEQTMAEAMGLVSK